MSNVSGTNVLGTEQIFGWFEVKCVLWPNPPTGNTQAGDRIRTTKNVSTVFSGRSYDF